MATVSAATTNGANLPAAQVFGKSGGDVRLLSAVMQKLRAMYPEKTAANIAVRARVSTRAAEYWLSDAPSSRDMSAEAFLALLVSEDGGAILEALMGALPAKQRPAWWRRHANIVRMAAIEKAQAEQDEEIRQLRLELAGK